jgi:DsbC/DsbD-like thiol-disulfide interchange protein
MKRISRAALPALLLSLGLPLTASAASSEWVNTLGGDVRIVALPAAGDGTIRAILDIRLHEGWKTYWRDPGGSGIPPALSISGAAEIVSLGFPVPKHFTDGTLGYIAYDKPVALPLTLRKTGNGPLKASVFLGVCKDICIPVQAELSVDTGAETFANPLEEMLIAEAEADLPAGSAQDFAALSSAWSTDGKSLEVSFKAPLAEDGSMPEVFVSGPGNFQFGAAGALEKHGEAYVATVPVLHRPKKADLSAKPILFTVRSGDRTMETPLAID